MIVECSNCRCEFDIGDSQTILDSPFDGCCPRCEVGVIKGGDGSELRRRINQRENINQGLKQIAKSATTAELGTGYRHHIEEIEEMVDRIHTQIQKEIEMRSDE